jgi:anhydro-N-acetylmuramic acid kinase
MLAWVSAIGLMSGTSLDGVDAALINTDGERVGRLGPTGYRAYTETERGTLIAALAAARNLADRRARPGPIAEAESIVTAVHAEAIEALLAASGIERDSVGVVGFHGQTVLHRPQQRLTIQIGDGRALAQRVGIPVVYDFRAADVAAGGEGAPLVPAFHRALIANLDQPHPIAVLNIGGVANLTFIDGNEDPIACDVGPGNALIDDFVRARSGQPYDRDGAIAAMGHADNKVIDGVLARKFFSRPTPKSLDRDDFGDLDLTKLSIADGAATLTALTVACVVRAVEHLPRKPASWIVAGGGARNNTIVRALSKSLSPAQVETADAIGWSVDALEAQAFGYLAVRTLKGLPITFPSTTGAPRPLVGGLVVSANR